MNSDAQPPQAGEEKGVRAPAEKTTAAAPSGAAANPYAGLSVNDLSRKLYNKHKAENHDAERLRLIRALEGNPDPPDPLKDLTALARRLREKIPAHPGGGGALLADIAGLRALYADLLHNMGERGLETRDSLNIALRALRQAQTSFIALRRLQLLENQQTPPEKK